MRGSVKFTGRRLELRPSNRTCAVIFVEKRTNHTLQKQPEKEKLDAKLDF